MADKDNANPTIYQPTSVSVRRPTSTTGGAAGSRPNDWWRDPTVHGSSRASADDDDDDQGDDEEDSDDATMVDDTVESKTRITGNKNLSKEKEEKIDAHEVFDLVRSISDPEHPLTLEQLAVVRADQITVTHGDPDAKGQDRLPRVRLEFTPTIPHCSMATLIGLALRVRLLRSLPPRFKVDISIKPGTHQSERAVNKQLNDKERVAAALENESLFGVVSDCIATANRRGMSEEEALAEAEKRARELGLVN